MKTELIKQATPHYFTFTEEADVVKELIEQEYEQKIKSNFEADGFRKGHVPRKVAEAKPGFDRFTAYRGVFDKLYIKALESAKLSVADSFDFEVKGPFDDVSPLSVRATVYLMPKVVSFDLEKISIPLVKPIEVNDTMVDEQIKILLDKAAKFANVIDKDYVIKKGDIMIIDYVGRVGTEIFKGGSAKAFKYAIGETKFIPGFEEQLLKMKPEQTGKINVKFPEDYFSTDLRNKDVEFTVTVLKVESRTDISMDEFLKTGGEFKTIDEFKVNMREKLIADQKTISEETFMTNVLSTCIKNAEIDPIPQSMVRWDIDNQWNRLMYQLGTTEDKYLIKFPNAKNVFYEQRNSRAEREIQMKLFLAYVAEQQNISVSEEEMNEYVADRSKKLNKSDEEKKDLEAKLKNDRNRAAVLGSIKDDKATQYLVQYFKTKNA